MRKQLYKSLLMARLNRHNGAEGQEAFEKAFCDFASDVLGFRVESRQGLEDDLLVVVYHAEEDSRMEFLEEEED